MAASNSLENKIADITECSICTKVFKEPVCLPCAHTFCLGCVKAYGRGLKSNSKAQCPICRKKFAVPSGGWKALPCSYIVKKQLSTTEPGRATVKNTPVKGESILVDFLTKSVDLQIEKCR